MTMVRSTGGWRRAWGVALAVLAALSAAGPAGAQETNAPPVAIAGRDAVEQELRRSLDELAGVRDAIAAEKVPLMEKMHALEQALLTARKDYEAVKRQLDSRNLDMTNLRNEVKARDQEKAYLSSLLGEYVRNLETRLHIAELGRYQAVIEGARLAPENGNLKPAEVFAEQVRVVALSLTRLQELLGGSRFAGRAAGEDGLVKAGQFALLGPVAYFASGDGSLAGVAEQRLGSLEPSVQPFADPALADLTRVFVNQGAGEMPFDATLGSARKIEETKESLLEHIGKGGAVMYPLLGVGGVAALVALVKWLVLASVKLPRAADMGALLAAVRGGDRDAARTAADKLRGAPGAMLQRGCEHLDKPKDLIEEVMFEQVLETRFRLNQALPLIAVCAACAPLLGLLGTVTGIIGTFKLITVFGSGDVKMLSAGISEALITTEFGLYVAIPCILAHSFLSRKAKAILDGMERLAIAFLTEVEKARAPQAQVSAAPPAAPAVEVSAGEGGPAVGQEALA